MKAEDLRLYTQTAGDEQIHELALQVTKEADGYYAKAAAIERFLKENYLYSLKPGIAEDGNQLRHFLFVSRKGYCSYFAFAMALMCRSLGIPARVAVGFSVDPQSEVLNFYQVRAFQAHAWVEVYFGPLGWVEFDPTSATLAPGEDFAPSPGPDKDKMARLIAEIVKNQTGIEEQVPKTPAIAASASRLGRELALAAMLVARLWYVVLPALYVLLLLVTKVLPLVPGLLSRDARRRARAGYTMCLVRCAGVGKARRSTESALEHAGRLGRESIALAPVASVYLKAAFAEHFDNGDIHAAAPALAEFSRTFRLRIGLPLRLLGMVNPLGVAPRRL
jgi:hypothetical protein